VGQLGRHPLQNTQENPGSEKTTFRSAKFKCLRASLDSPAEWKNVEFDWDTANVAGPSLPTIPRCITPRP
jgi:hypothetical protein